jgi:ribosomal protein S27AE
MTTIGGRYRPLQCIACGPGSTLAPEPAYRGKCTTCGLIQSIASTDEERAAQARIDAAMSRHQHR